MIKYFKENEINKKLIYEIENREFLTQSNSNPDSIIQQMPDKDINALIEEQKNNEEICNIILYKNYGDNIILYKDYGNNIIEQCTLNSIGLILDVDKIYIYIKYIGDTKIENTNKFMCNIKDIIEEKITANIVDTDKILKLVLQEIIKERFSHFSFEV
jgi:hypothetical protein